MNRRALKLVITALIVATMGVIAAPGVSIADPQANEVAQVHLLDGDAQPIALAVGPSRLVHDVVDVAE